MRLSILLQILINIVDRINSIVFNSLIWSSGYME